MMKESNRVLVKRNEVIKEERKKHFESMMNESVRGRAEVTSK